MVTYPVQWGAWKQSPNQSDWAEYQNRIPDRGFAGYAVKSTLLARLANLSGAGRVFLPLSNQSISKGSLFDFNSMACDQAVSKIPAIYQFEAVNLVNKTTIGLINRGD